MSTTSPSLDSCTLMKQRSDVLTLGSNPIVSMDSDRCLIDFEETRFRIHALRLQKELRPLATDLALELGVKLSSLDDLAGQTSADLQTKVYCAFDFLDIKSRTDKGFQKTKWIPLAIFIGGDRVFSLHATHSNVGSYLSGLTMRREGLDEYTRCRTTESALKVGKSYLRTYGPR